MKKQSIAYATLREGKDVVACWPTEPRPVDWFVQIVKAESRKHPASPVRIDTLKAEHEQTTAALNKLGAGWRLVTAAHIRHALRGEGVQRTAFYGPQCPFPEPVQSVDVKPKKGETVQAATRRTVEALRRKHGPDAHIEHGQRRRKGDRFPSVPFCAAWLAADWIQQHLGQFTATEIVHGLRENTGLAQHYEPLAIERQTQRKRKVEIAREKLFDDDGQHKRKAKVKGKTVDDWKEQFIYWYGKRGTMHGAATEVAKESGFSVDAIRMAAGKKRGRWIE